MKKSMFLLLGLGLGLLGGCDSQEAPRVILPIEVDSAGLVNVTTDLGYEVTIKRARVAVSNLQFTIRGEMHASLWRSAADLFIKEAHAHPGHSAGGDVTGELPGSFILGFGETVEKKTLGNAVLFAGTYKGMNLSFRKAGAADGLSPKDPLFGHTAYLEGVARKDGKEVPFHAQVDVDEGVKMVGAPFGKEITETNKDPIQVQILTKDPFKNKTLFGGIEFAELAPEADGQVAMQPGQDAHNILRRSLSAHDYYFVK